MDNNYASIRALLGRFFQLVSLYGKTSVDEINRLILSQGSVRASIEEKLNGVPIIKDLSGIINIVHDIDISGTVICFDDFERKSKKISIKEIFGVANHFAENKKCKIFLLMDEDVILSKSEFKIFNKRDVNDYNLFKEKTITKEFKLSIDKNEIIQNMLNLFDQDIKTEIANAINTAKETNLRIIKKFDFRRWFYSLNNSQHAEIKTIFN